MRRRSEERLVRLRDLKQLSMGIDVGGLDKQVEEKKEKERERLAEEDAYDSYVRQVSSLVGNREEAEKRALREAREELKAEWAHEAVSFCERKERDAGTKSTDPDDCGLCAAQRFEGEDFDLDIREKVKAKLNKKRFDEQVREKVEKQDKEKRDEEAFCEYERFVTEKRKELERLDQERSLDARLKLQEEHFEATLSKKSYDQKIKERIQRVEDSEIDCLVNDPHLTEDTAMAKSCLAAHRYRPDHFKGYSEETRRAAKLANAELVRQKHQQQQHDKDFDTNYFNFMTMQLHCANDMNDQDEQQRRLAKTQLSHEYQAQALTQKKQRAQEHKNSFGHVSPHYGYLAGFGTSAR